MCVYSVKYCIFRLKKIILGPSEWLEPRSNGLDCIYIEKLKRKLGKTKKVNSALAVQYHWALRVNLSCPYVNNGFSPTKLFGYKLNQYRSTIGQHSTTVGVQIIKHETRTLSFYFWNMNSWISLIKPKLQKYCDTFDNTLYKHKYRINKWVRSKKV